MGVGVSLVDLLEPNLLSGQVKREKAWHDRSAAILSDFCGYTYSVYFIPVLLTARLWYFENSGVRYLNVQIHNRSHLSLQIITRVGRCWMYYG